MRIEILATTYLPYISNIQTCSVKEINPGIENEEMKRYFDEEKQKVQPIYNSQGKVIGHNKDGRKLDVLV